MKVENGNEIFAAKEWLENLVPILTPANEFADIFDKIPHVPLGNLEIVFCFDNPVDGDWSFVQNDNLETLGIDAGELLEIVKNGKRFKSEIQVTTLDNVIEGIHLDKDLSEVKGIDLDDPSWVKEMDDIFVVVSNKSFQYGAASILDSTVTEKLSDLLKGDLYIFPSTIHECFVASADAINLELAKDLFQAVNDASVRPEEKLSDELFFYDSKTKKIGLARDPLIDKGQPQRDR